MHYAQSAVYAMLGLDKLQEDFVKSKEEELYTTTVDLQYLPENYYNGF